MNFIARVICAAIVSIGLVAVPTIVAQAGPSTISSPQGVTVGMYKYYGRGNAGLSGNLGIKMGDGKQFNMGQPWQVMYDGQQDNLWFTQLQAGSGYCVWEEVYQGLPNQTKMNKFADINYGKSQSRRWYYTFLNDKRFQDPQYDYAAYYYIYAC